MDADEFHTGSPRVSDYLERYGSPRRRWDPPPPDDEAPEAEWGLGEPLREQLHRVAADHGHQLMTCAFEDPEELSPAVAALYRSWYERENRPSALLLVESFVLVDSWWTLALGAGPLWLKFPVDSSADRLAGHLDDAAYDNIAIGLFSHGTEGVGVTPIERWAALARRARRHGRLLGVDPRRYPRDFATFARFHTELRRLGTPRPLPDPLPVTMLEPALP